jgi:hypothetical protein
MGAFDDLIPSGGATLHSGTFDDLIPKADPKIGQPEELTWYEKLAASAPAWATGGNLRGSAVGGVMHGMAKPVAGAAQWAASVLPEDNAIRRTVDENVRRVEGEYQAARKDAGREGFDAAVLAGEVLSPTNIALAAKLPMAATKLGRVAQGAAVGGAVGGMQPVTDPNAAFWREKVGQVAGGAAAGAILNPIVGKLGDMLLHRIQRASPQARAAAAANVDSAIETSLREVGATIDDVHPAQLEVLRAQVRQAAAGGRELDAAAALRKADFEALGMEGTAGQISRDPMAFARERNLRGVEGVGEPLMAHLQKQAQQLQDRVTGPAAGAKDAYNAGTQLVDSLRGTDEILRRHVGGLYREARGSAGKDLDVPLHGLAQDYAATLERFGDAVPAAVQRRFRALGLDPAAPSNQRQVFTFEAADNLLKDLNAHVGSDPVVNRALGELRGALRNAVQSTDASGGPFAPAVRAARERFELHDAVPALKAAAEGAVAPDDFVRRFIVSGKTDEVKALAKVLKQADPEAFQQARLQIAERLRQAAMGENIAGDAVFNARRLQAEIKRIGQDKLTAFFDKNEILDMWLMGRVGSYINQPPALAAVNTSNTASAWANLGQLVPGAGRVREVARAVRDRRDVERALNPRVRDNPARLEPRYRNALAALRAGATAGGGTSGGRDWGRR